MGNLGVTQRTPSSGANRPNDGPIGMMKAPMTPLGSINGTSGTVAERIGGCFEDP